MHTTRTQTEMEARAIVTAAESTRPSASPMPHSRVNPRSPPPLLRALFYQCAWFSLLIIMSSDSFGAAHTGDVVSKVAHELFVTESSFLRYTPYLLSDGEVRGENPPGLESRKKPQNKSNYINNTSTRQMRPNLYLRARRSNCYKYRFTLPRGGIILSNHCCQLVN